MTQDDWETRLDNPEAAFASPEVLAADGLLSASQKIDLLHAWERNTHQLLAADEEATVGQEESGRADRLLEIHTVLARLGSPHDPNHGQPDIPDTTA